MGRELVWEWVVSLSLVGWAVSVVGLVVWWLGLEITLAVPPHAREPMAMAGLEVPRV